MLLFRIEEFHRRVESFHSKDEWEHQNNEMVLSRISTLHEIHAIEIFRIESLHENHAIEIFRIESLHENHATDLFKHETFLFRDEKYQVKIENLIDYLGWRGKGGRNWKILDPVILYFLKTSSFQVFYFYEIQTLQKAQSCCSQVF